MLRRSNMCKRIWMDEWFFLEEIDLVLNKSRFSWTIWKPQIYSWDDSGKITWNSAWAKRNVDILPNWHNTQIMRFDPFQISRKFSRTITDGFTKETVFWETVQFFVWFQESPIAFHFYCKFCRSYRVSNKETQIHTVNESLKIHKTIIMYFPSARQI